MITTHNAPLKRLAAVLLFVFGAFTLPSSSIGQVEEEALTQAPEASPSGEMVFLTGEDLSVSQETTDDLFAAASTVNVVGASAHHMFLGGGDVTVSSARVHDVVAAGGNIRLEAANVADDIIVAGGDIFAGENFEIGGSAVVFGGDVQFSAPVTKDLRIGASEIFLNSQIGGTANLSGDQIVLGPKARIAGDLNYQGSSLTVDPAAVIEGERAQMEANETFAPEDIGRGVGLMVLFFGLSVLFSYFVIVAVLVLIVRRVMEATSQMLERKPLQALGIGVLYALSVPVLGLILVETGLGIPLAIFLFIASLALTPIATAVTAHFLGMLARKIITRKTGYPEDTPGRILWPLSGVIILLALSLVPIVGPLILFFAMLFGLGAFGRQVLSMLSMPEEPRAGTPAMA